MILLSYILFLTSIFLIFLFDRIQIKRNWYDPLYAFLILNAVYVSPLTLRYILNLPVEGNVTDLFYKIHDIFPYAVMANTLALFAFYFSYRLTNNNLLTNYIIKTSKKIEKKKLNFFLAGWLATITGASLFIAASQGHGGVLSVLLSGYAVTLAFTESPILPLSLSILTSGSFLFLANYSFKKEKASILLSIAVLSFAFLIQIILGRRAEIAVWGLSYIIYYSLIIKPISSKKLIIILTSSFLFLNILGLARQANYESFDTVFDNINNQASLSRENKSDFFYTLTTGQFVVPFETLPILMDDLKFSEMQFGSTLPSIVTQWIPRGFWENKPYGLSNWFMRRFYDSSAPVNEGRQFYYLSEGYINFGFPGIILWGLLWGFLLKSISILLNKKNNNLILPSYIGSIYCAGLVTLLANDLTGFFVAFPKNTISAFLTLYILLLLSSQFKRK